MPRKPVLYRRHSELQNYEALRYGEAGYEVQDKYGLSWQVVPVALIDMLRDPDPNKSQRATQAMLQMKKLDIEQLRRAYA